MSVHATRATSTKFRHSVECEIKITPFPHKSDVLRYAFLFIAKLNFSSVTEKCVCLRILQRIVSKRALPLRQREVSELSWAMRGISKGLPREESRITKETRRRKANSESGVYLLICRCCRDHVFYLLRCIAMRIMRISTCTKAGFRISEFSRWWKETVQWQDNRD